MVNDPWGATIDEGWIAEENTDGFEVAVGYFCGRHPIHCIVCKSLMGYWTEHDTPQETCGADADIVCPDCQPRFLEGVRARTIGDPEWAPQFDAWELIPHTKKEK